MEVFAVINIVSLVFSHEISLTLDVLAEKAEHLEMKCKAHRAQHWKLNKTLREALHKSLRSASTLGTRNIKLSVANRHSS